MYHCNMFVTLTYRTDIDAQPDIPKMDVFPGMHSNCLYFSVDKIEFDIHGTLHVKNILVYFWRV